MVSKATYLPASSPQYSPTENTPIGGGAEPILTLCSLDGGTFSNGQQGDNSLLGACRLEQKSALDLWAILLATGQPNRMILLTPQK